jgi:hypothetical protein
MRVRYQADNDLNRSILRGVVRREPLVDFRSAHHAGLHSVEDVQVLRVAAADGRILVTHDFQTMPNHFRHFTRSEHSPGVFLISQDLAVGRAVESLLTIWEVSEAEEWTGRMCLIPSLVTIVMGPMR